MKYKLNQIVFYLYKMEIITCRVIKRTNIESITEIENKKLYTLSVINKSKELDTIDVLESEIFTSANQLKNNIKII